MTFSIKSTVFFRSVKTPNEKRMKSGFANNCTIASTSSSRKERRMSLLVSRVGMSRSSQDISISFVNHASRHELGAFFQAKNQTQSTRDDCLATCQPEQAGCSRSPYATCERLVPNAQSEGERDHVGRPSRHVAGLCL